MNDECLIAPGTLWLNKRTTTGYVIMIITGPEPTVYKGCMAMEIKTVSALHGGIHYEYYWDLDHFFGNFEKIG